MDAHLRKHGGTKAGRTRGCSTVEIPRYLYEVKDGRAVAKFRIRTILEPIVEDLDERDRLVRNAAKTHPQKVVCSMFGLQKSQVNRIVSGKRTGRG